MTQYDRQAHWVVTENITRFQEQLRSETDTCQRKLLEALLVLEREKLKAIAPPPQSFGAAAGKAPHCDDIGKKQG